jgi:hypothetical protein
MVLHEKWGSRLRANDGLRAGAARECGSRLPLVYMTL